MVESIQNINEFANYKLDDIFAPVALELSSLERKLIKELSGKNFFLNGISEHVIKAGGKRIRPALVFLFAKAFNGEFISANHFKLAIASELIHTATLIHDDIIDGANIRRGAETVNSKWNDKAAVIAGDYLLAKSLKNLALTKSNAVVEIFASTMGEICEGEIIQNEKQHIIPSMEDYIEKSKRKTAMLFIACTESAAIISPETNNLKIKAAREYALNFGIAFQIIDDVLNYLIQNEEADKPVASDLLNGIITAPALFAIEEYSQKNDFKLKNILEKNSLTNEDYELALLLILKTNSIQKSIKLAEHYTNKAIRALDILPESNAKKSLTDLAQYIINRKK